MNPLIISFNSTVIFSQNNTRAQKFFEDGNLSFNIGEFEDAIVSYKKSLRINPNYCKSLYKLGLSYKKLKQLNKYEQTFSGLIDKVCSEFLDQVHYGLGELYFYKGKNNLASNYFDKIYDTTKFLYYSELTKNLKFGLKYKGVDLFHISKLDTLQNFVHQYFPFYDSKESKLFYTARLGDRLFDDENIFYSIVNNFSFSSQYFPVKHLNTDNNEGTLSYSNNNNFIVFTSCEMNFKKNSCDLYYSIKSNEQVWSKPKKFSENINSEYWESQPFVYNDNLIFFVSNRPGGMGGRDIWYSKKNDSDEWENAKNLKYINSNSDEISPYFKDNIFYFSSNRLESFGGFDIYYTTEPYFIFNNILNVGKSINNYDDQTSLFISDDLIFITEELKISNKIKSKILLGRIDKKNYDYSEHLIIFIKDSLTKFFNSSEMIVFKFTAP